MSLRLSCCVRRRFKKERPLGARGVPTGAVAAHTAAHANGHAVQLLSQPSAEGSCEEKCPAPLRLPSGIHCLGPAPRPPTPCARAMAARATPYASRAEADGLEELS